MSHQLDKAARLKISKIQKIYDKKLISTYRPYPTPKDILTKLKQNQEFEHCPHELYTSSEAFANHILWILHPTSIDHHDQYLYLTFRDVSGTGICSNCINVLLSVVTFKDHINFYAMSGNSRLQQHMCHLLFEHYCCHPKLPKIMVRTCELSKDTYSKGNKKKLENNMKIKLNDGTFDIGFFVHDFQYLCSLMILTTMHNVFGRTTQLRYPELTTMHNVFGWTRQLRYFRI
eukprot:281016_1